MYPLVLSIVLLTISLGLLGLNVAPLTGLTWEAEVTESKKPEIFR